MPRLHGQSPVITRIHGWSWKTTGAGGGGGAAPLFASGEEGDVNNSTVEITFDQNIVSSDYAAGWILKINGVSDTIVSATRQANHALVYFVTTTPIDIDDVVTVEYDDDFGDYEAEDDAVDMLDITAQATTNYVGSQYYFNSEWSSGHFAHL